MKRLFVIEFDYFNNRKEIFDSLKIISNQSEQILTGFNVFINNIPSSLEFYVHLSYDGNLNNEIDQMKNLLFSKGIYSPDISLNILMDRISERGFNSYSVSSPLLDYILKFGFLYANKNQILSYKLDSELYKKYLKKEGYLAVEKIGKGTSLFLSHSSKQKELLESIIPYLVSKNELVWIDKYRLKSSDKKEIVQKGIAVGLNDSNKVLFYVTSDFLQSYWCNFELEFSYDIYKENKKVSLFFIVDEDIKRSFELKYRKQLRDIPSDNIVFFNKKENIEKVIISFKTLTP